MRTHILIFVISTPQHHCSTTKPSERCYAKEKIYRPKIPESNPPELLKPRPPLSIENNPPRPPLPIGNIPPAPPNMLPPQPPNIPPNPPPPCRPRNPLESNAPNIIGPAIPNTFLARLLLSDRKSV